MFDQPDNDPNYYLHPNELCHHCGAMPDEDGCPECSEPDEDVHANRRKLTMTKRTINLRIFNTFIVTGEVCRSEFWILADPANSDDNIECAIYNNNDNKTIRCNITGTELRAILYDYIIRKADYNDTI